MYLLYIIFNETLNIIVLQIIKIFLKVINNCMARFHAFIFNFMRCVR